MEKEHINASTYCDVENEAGNGLSVAKKRLSTKVLIKIAVVLLTCTFLIGYHVAVNIVNWTERIPINFKSSKDFSPKPNDPLPPVIFGEKPPTRVVHKCCPTLVKRKSTTKAASLHSTPAVCDLKQDSTTLWYDVLHFLSNSYKKQATDKYFNDILDPTTSRNRDINSKYYSYDRLKQFKNTEFYTSHINSQLQHVQSGQTAPNIANTNSNSSVINLNTLGQNISSNSTAFSNASINYYSAQVDSSNLFSNDTITMGSTTIFAGNDSVPPNVTAVEFLTGGKKLYPIHSHNDYTRDVPLFDALQRGYKSVEADLWYYPKSCDHNLASLKEFALASDSKFSGDSDTYPALYVSHNKFGLSRYRTLETLYLNHLSDLLDEINEFYGIPESSAPNEKAGVFFNYPNESLNIILDFKHNGYPTYKLVMRTIQSFIKRNYVTYYDFNTQTRIVGPLTFIVSGLAPYDLIQMEDEYRAQAGLGNRYLFIDAPLEKLSTNTTDMDYSRLSVYASEKFEDAIKSSQPDWNKYFKNKSFLQSDGTLDQSTVNATKTKFDLAHKMGIKSRLWGMPSYSDQMTTEIYDNLIKQSGLDFLNVDDLDKGIQIYDTAQIS